jgi:hypothetical protein
MTLQENSTKFRKGQVVGDSEGQESRLQIGQMVFSISCFLSHNNVDYIVCMSLILYYVWLGSPRAIE